MRPEALRAVVVEDEPLARAALLQELALHGVHVIGTADSLATARTVLQAHSPDLLFLDVELSDGCGLSLLDAAPPGMRTIVVSAFDAYAIRAFEVAVHDYLLKPVHGERLARSLARIGSNPQRVSEPQARIGYDDCLFLAPQPGSAHVIAVADLVAVCAGHDGCRLHLRDGRSVPSAHALLDWETRLPENAFVRIHRATLINLRRVLRVESWFDRRFRVRMEGMEGALAISRRQALALRRRFEGTRAASDDAARGARPQRPM